MVDQQYVRDVMVEPTQTIDADHLVAAARQRMQGAMNVKSLIVVQGGRPVGLVRYNDIAIETAPGATVAEIMVPEVPAVRADQSLADLAGVMTEYDIDRLPVVDTGGALVGEVPRDALTLATTTGSEAATSQETLSGAQSGATTPVFNVRADMAVVGAGGGKIGTVKEVISDALSGGLTHVVVRTGLIFSKDKAIPADLIDGVEGDEVCLKVDKSEVDILPDLSADA
jgi:CBS domain-containing protein/sporulation protein YlmC with PRC-barrel domain